MSERNQSQRNYGGEMDDEEIEERDEDEYGYDMQEEEVSGALIWKDDETEEGLDFESFKNMIENRDEANQAEKANARTNLFITKNSPIYHTLLEIKTGEQAISFFAKHGSNTPIKFLNCNRAKTSLD